MNVEQTVQNIAHDPWVFIFLAFLTVVSAVAPLFIAFRFFYKISRSLATRGSKPLWVWIGQVVRARALSIATSLYPGAHFCMMIIRSLALIVPILVFSTFMTAALTLDGISLDISILQFVATRIFHVSVHFWIIPILLTIIVLNGVVWTISTVIDIITLGILANLKLDNVAEQKGDAEASGDEAVGLLDPRRDASN